VTLVQGFGLSSDALGLWSIHLASSPISFVDSHHHQKTFNTRPRAPVRIRTKDPAVGKVCDELPSPPHDSTTPFRVRMRLNFLGRNSAWKYAQCRRTTIGDAQRRAFSTPGQPLRIFDKRRKRRAVQLAAAGTLTASAAFLSDEIKHGYNAAERSARVMSTLAVCVNEYVLKFLVWLIGSDEIAAATERLSSRTPMIPTKKH
jgi:hypothetical protein